MFGPADSNELLLLHRAILGEVEGKVQMMARGRRMFPFAHVRVTLVAAEEERRTILQAAFGERLGADIREALEGSETRTAARLRGGSAHRGGGAGASKSSIRRRGAGGRPRRMWWRCRRGWWW